MIGHTDNAAHVGGLVMGLMLGALIAKVAPRREDVCRRLAVLLFGMLLVFGGAMWLRHAHPHF